jgi:glucokinase
VVKDCTRYTNYEGRNLREELEAVSHTPVSVNNDCYVGVYGEIWMGAAQGYSAVTGVMLGTGVGGAIYENGRFLHGGHFGAGELGHQILHRGGIPCFCGQAGCVERYVSGTALWEQYNLKTGREAISSGYEFFDLLHAGDEAAKAVLDTFVDDLSFVMVNIANLCDPGAFLVGGGLADTRGDWADMLQQRYESYAGPYLRKTPIIYASRGNDAALLGAAKFAIDVLNA